MTIDTIVFDIGNVLISYQPFQFHNGRGDSPEKANIYLSEIYHSPEWQKLDQGTIMLSEAINSIAAKSSLTIEEIASVFSLREELLFPIIPNTDLLAGLRDEGYRLYYLSNFPEDMFRILSEKHCFFRYFNGGVVSSDVKVLKPDRAIYRILVERYGINQATAIFIDDLLPNVEAAASEGFITLHLTDPSQLGSNLRSLLSDHRP